MNRAYVFLLALSSFACAVPASRVPLPVPFMPTNGATTVPGNGAGIGGEFGNGMLGPELAQGDMRGTAVGLGIKDRVSITLGNPRSRGNIEGHATKADLQQLRMKAVLLKPWGKLPAVALYGGHAWGDRLIYRQGSSTISQDTLQNDRVSSWEVALPMEFLLGRPDAGIRPSVFVGPRVAFTQYTDHVRSDGTFSAVFPGAVGGLHVSAYIFELFLESTVAYIPEHAYAGGVFGGRWRVMPAMGAIMRIGPAFNWAP